jgi:hypothetical protein
MMRNRIIAFTAALLLTGAVSAQASAIVGTSTAGENGGYGLGWSFQNDVNLAIGQAFTMGAAAQLLNAATVWLNDYEGGFSGASFTFQIMDAVGASATAANVLYQTSALFPDTEGGPHAPVTMSGIGLALAANTTYYLVISTAAGQNANQTGHGWGTTTGPYIEPFATVGSAYVGIRVNNGVADYTDLQENTGGVRTLFLLESQDAAVVPEPTTLLLLGSGLLAASRRMRRRS